MKVDKKFYKESFTGLPPWAKGVIAVVVVGGVAFVGWKIYKLLKDATSIEKQREKDVIKTVDKEIKDEMNKGETLSKPLSAYKSAANLIDEKLQGCELTPVPEIEVIKTVVSVVKKPIDWLTLQKEFGVRTIDNCLWGSGETQYELAKLLKDQLDQPIDRKVEAEGFVYDPFKSGIKTTSDILKIYLNKVGVTI